MKKRTQKKRRKEGSPGPAFVFSDLRKMRRRRRRVYRSKMQGLAPLGGHSVYKDGARALAALESHAVWKNHRLSTWVHPWGCAGCIWSRPRC